MLKKNFPKKKILKKIFPKKNFTNKSAGKSCKKWAQRVPSNAAKGCSPPQELEKRAAIFLVYFKGGKKDPMKIH